MATTDRGPHGRRSLPSRRGRRAPELYPKHWESDVVLADGGTVHLRPVRPDDGDKLQDLYYAPLRRVAVPAVLLARPAADGPSARAALRVSTTTAGSRSSPSSATTSSRSPATTAPAPTTTARPRSRSRVQDDQHGRGLGTHPARAPRRRSRAKRASAASRPRRCRTTRRCCGVFSDAGFEVSRRFDGGTVEVSFAIDPTRPSRSRCSATASTEPRPARWPGSSRRATIAVVGASRRPATIGHEVLRNLLGGGFTGPVYPVHPTRVVGRRRARLPDDRRRPRPGRPRGRDRSRRGGARGRRGLRAGPACRASSSSRPGSPRSAATTPTSSTTSSRSPAATACG